MYDWSSVIPEVGLRPQQQDALDRIWTAFEDGADVVLFQAPTGIGKSIVELAVCRRFAQEGMGSSFIVTPQKALQDQLARWEGLRVMKGRSSYRCNLSDDSAATAPCTLSGSVREDNPECSDRACPFYRALAEATASQIVVHNYASLLAQSYISSHFGRRGLMALDEGHTASSWIRNFATFEMSDSIAREIDGNFDPHDGGFLAWFCDIISSMDEVPRGISDEARLLLVRAMAFKSLLPLEGETSVPWDAVRDDRAERWTLLPLKVSKLARVLTGLADKILIVTATVLDERLMTAELGLMDASRKSVIIDDAFPVKNRPIIKRYVGSMSYASKNRTFPKLVDSIVEICRRHHDEAGIIHTTSHALAVDIIGALRHRLQERAVERVKEDGSRDETIRSFLAGLFGPNALLVGPALMEGIDGAGDSCRFQVMTKAPWPNMTDPVVKAQMALTGRAQQWAQAWYAWKAAQVTVQGFGRVVRGPDDYGVTYLLDSSFARILASPYIPRYVTAAIK